MLTGFRCSICKKDYGAERPPFSCSKCGGILLAEYELDRIEQHTIKSKDSPRSSGMWRYERLLPFFGRDTRITLGEGDTFLHSCKRLSQETGFRYLFLKDETRNPTGSFIDRGVSVEVSMAKEWGHRSLCCGSTGNLAASLAAYAARAGIHSTVFIAQRGDVDVGKFHQILAFGGDVEIVSGREKAMKSAAELSPQCHNVTSSSPFFLEGIKTTAFEVCQQLDWEPPDWIVVPMGNGGHLTMIWRALEQLEIVGLIDQNTTKLIGVQAEGCSPIVKAFERDSNDVEPVATTKTVAMDIGIENPSCGTLALGALRQSRGTAISVKDSEILEAIGNLARLEGIFAEPAAATTIAGLAKVREEGIIDHSEKVVCMITGMGLKYHDIARVLVKGRGPLEHLLSRVEGRRYTTELGRTKRYILKILQRGESYGYEIRKSLEEDYGVRISSPSVYQHLSELAKAGLIVATRSEKSLERRLRNYYDLSDRGRWTLGQLERISRPNTK